MGMVNYRYIARNTRGEKVAGLMSVENESMVLRALDEQQLFAIRISPEQPSALREIHRVRQRDLAMVYSQLADLLTAGVPMLRALRTLVRTVVPAGGQQ